MKELVKRYFLFIAPHPILWSLVISVLLFYTFIAILAVKNRSNDPLESFEALNISYPAIVLYFLFVATHILVVYKKITILPLDKGKIILFLSPEQEIKIYEKPLWINEEQLAYWTIHLPDDWETPISQLELLEMPLSLTVPLRGKKVIFGFDLLFNFSDNFKPEELYDLIRIHGEKFPGKRDYQFNDLIERVFAFTNLSAEQQQKLCIIAEDWTEGKIIRAVLAMKVEKIVVQPKKIFSTATIQLLDNQNPLI